MIIQNSVNNIIYGTTTNDDASSGQVGEYIFSSVLSGSAVSLSSGSMANVTSISLTAGDWDVRGLIALNPSLLTVISSIESGISTSSASIPTIGSENNVVLLNVSITTGAAQVLNLGPTRLSINSTTTVYLVAKSVFSIGTNSAYGFIGARRVR